MSTQEWIAAGLAALGVLGIAFGIRCYVELWRWARQCQNARVAIAYNSRVQFQGTFTEFLNWTNALKGTKERGRVIYRNGKVTVSLLRPTNHGRTRTQTVKENAHKLRNSLPRRKAKVTA